MRGFLDLQTRDLHLVSEARCICSTELFVRFLLLESYLKKRISKMKV